MNNAPTMKDVAKAAGVSVMTVSRAFKQDASVSAGTRQRVHDVADRLGYLFDGAASNLRSQKSSFVAVVVPSIKNENFADMVRAMSEGLGEAELHVLLAFSSYDLGREERIIRQVVSQRPSAIVVTGGKHTKAARELLMKSRIPVVEIWDMPVTPINHAVGFSHAETMHDLVGHLVDRGYSRIGFIGSDTKTQTRGAERRRGFIEAMQQRGLQSDHIFLSGVPPYSMSDGAAAMRMVIDAKTDLQAVICVSDTAAFGALTECLRQGIQVPEEMAIAGFGGFELARVSEPSITTVDPKSTEIGRKTADLLIPLVGASMPESACIRVEVKPEIIVGTSTGLLREPA